MELLNQSSIINEHAFFACTKHCVNKCSNISTWHPSHCCNECVKTKGYKHGPYCSSRLIGEWVLISHSNLPNGTIYINPDNTVDILDGSEHYWETMSKNVIQFTIKGHNQRAKFDGFGILTFDNDSDSNPPSIAQNSTFENTEMKFYRN